MARIVVIEDDDFTRSTLRLALEGMGHRVITARNGVEGVDACRRDSPDIVITDIFMPERDGFETIRDLKRLNPHIKVIGMSAGSALMASPGMGRGSILRYAEGFGADAGLAKPFTGEQLAETIDALLAKA